MNDITLQELKDLRDEVGNMSSVWRLTRTEAKYRAEMMLDELIKRVKKEAKGE